jgi:hypothetical protein
VLVQGGFVRVATAIGGGESEAATWEKVGSVAQFKMGVPRRITLPKGQVVFVTRQDSTHWLALSARCTHTPLASFPVQLKGTTVQLDTSRATRNATPTKGKGKGHEEDDEHEGEREHEGKKRHTKDDD